jgi:excinuclease UvrABC ATPase subunit
MPDAARASLAGSRIGAGGASEQVASTKGSYTGEYLKGMLGPNG